MRSTGRCVIGASVASPLLVVGLQNFVNLTFHCSLAWRHAYFLKILNIPLIGVLKLVQSIQQQNIDFIHLLASFESHGTCMVHV